MIGLPQFGIVIGSLGGMLMLMGLFPGVTGITPGIGIGLVQFAAIISGAVLLDIGAMLYIKHTFFVGRGANLTQQICIRLSLTGLVLAGFTGLADYLGFGSHSELIEPFFGPLQASVSLLLLLLAAVGVLLYAVSGAPIPLNGADAVRAEPPSIPRENEQVEDVINQTQ
ncbi:MAG: hypothetical protein SGJ24_08510 [Chloroflexota bacterium]|nr:hypothetical protein [Chloroflexota bacterium]